MTAALRFPRLQREMEELADALLLLGGVDMQEDAMEDE